MATHHVCCLALVLAPPPRRLGREAEGPWGWLIAMLTLDGVIAAYSFLTSS